MRFYAYRAYKSRYCMPRSYSNDVRTGEPPRPAGEVLVFSSKRERDSYVEQKFEVETFPIGVNYRALSTIDARTAKKLFPCHDCGQLTCVEVKDCAAHGMLKSELDAEANF